MVETLESARTTDQLLTVDDLAVGLVNSETPAIIERIQLTVPRRTVIGVLGESGSGKTMMSLALLGLLSPELAVRSGRIRFEGNDISGRENRRALEALRGPGMAMVPQQPTDCLNPIMHVGTQIERLLRLHRGFSRRDAHEEAAEILTKFGFAQPKAVLDAYPHQLSGGMAQRAVLAMALACRPKLLIADEPTTGLDVTTASEVLDYMMQVIAESEASALVVTHDVGVVAKVTDFLVVMHAGHIVERGPTAEVLTQPSHPYTQGLLASVPTVAAKAELIGIPGQVPSITDYPPGCRFVDRCSFAESRCSTLPPDFAVGDDHVSRCWLHEGQ